MLTAIQEYVIYLGIALMIKKLETILPNFQSGCLRSHPNFWILWLPSLSHHPTTTT